jgi:hypothetical protein
MKYALIGWLLATPVHMEFDTLAECRAMMQNVLPGRQR